MIPILAIVLITLTLSACSSTQYRAVDAEYQGQAEPLNREVLYHVAPEFYRDPPTCVIVRKSQNIQDRNLARQLATSLGQRLSGHVPRVIQPLQRQRLTRKLAYDLNNTSDLRRFSSQLRCPFYARIEHGVTSNDFMLIWSEKQAGFTVVLSRVSDDKIMWWAAHTARRGDGGVPLSPINAIGSAATAGLFHQDDEVTASLIDDAMRRMLRTLPDVR